MIHLHSHVRSVIDFILQDILKHAGPVVEQYRQADHAPDPSFVLQLPDETVTASNLFAVQKFFDGEFQFDVFFDSASSHSTLDSMCLDWHVFRMLTQRSDSRYN